jgi:enoyl-CoA hydratase/carnithine racemase
MTIRYEVRDSVAFFTIDNPKANAFTPEMHKQFYGHLRRFEIDRSARVGILTAPPDRPFSAGDDLKNRPTANRTPQEELEAYLFLHHDEGELPSRPGWDIDVLYHRRTKPIIAAIEGYCIGKGLIYVLLHSDIRLASSTARFGLPEIAYGMAGASGSTRLARQLAFVDAAWLALTGEIVDAEEAARMRLVNRVVPPGELAAAAEHAARMIARHPEIAVRVEMEALAIGMEARRQEAVQHTQNLYRLQRLGYGGHGANLTEILPRLKRGKQDQP